MDAMTEIFVLLPDYGDDGLGEPIAAFPDKPDATRWGQNHFKNKGKGWKVLPVQYIGQPKRKSHRVSQDHQTISGDAI